MNDPAPPLRYRLAVHDPVRRLLALSLEVPAAPGEVLHLRLPSWSPGSYMIREYARQVEAVAARRGSRRLRVERVAKDRWRVAAGPGTGPVRVEWRVYANELSVRTAHADDTHAFVPPTAAFLCPEGDERRALEVLVVAPRGWSVACSLDRAPGAPRGATLLRAADQEALHDAPIHLGVQRRRTFRVRGVPHELWLWGEGNADEPRLARDLEAIVAAGARLFGGLPYTRYCVQGLLADAGGGGLEHRDGFVFQWPRWNFRPERAHRRCQELLAHEFFHAWNVRRIRPAGLLPYDLTAEKYTRLLWHFEGGTSAYAALLCRRAGLWSADDLLRHFGDQASALASVPGRRLQPLEEASTAAWVKHYRPDENTPNTAISYYLKGETAVLALDLRIRAASGGRRSYDDVMRLLWRRHGRTGIPVPEDAFPGVLREATGVDCRDLHARVVRGTGDPDWEALWAPFGVRVVRRGPEGATGAWLAVQWEERAGRTLARVVRADGPAAGRVAAGDELVALDGMRAGKAQVVERLAERTPGARARLVLLRGDRLVEAEVRLARPPLERLAFEVDASAPAAARRLRRGLLGP